MPVSQGGCEATNVCVVGSSQLIGDALARLLGGLDRSIRAWSTESASAPSDDAPAEPDVVVLEVAELNGVAERAQQIRTRWPEARIVLVVRDDSVTWRQVASDIGASGPVSSRLGPTALASAVMGSLGDGHPRPGGRDRPAPQSPLPTAGLDGVLSRLTPREGEVFRLLLTGLSAHVIATRLGVSSNTVRSHLQAVLLKLGVHSRLQAVALAHRAGLTFDGSRFPDNSFTGTADTAH